MKTLQIKEALIAFCSEQDGVTAIEYALLAVLITIAIASSVALAGTAVRDLFESVAAAFP